MSASNNPFGDVVFSYSRSQAIADGVLVDLGQFGITREHWKFPMACTDTVWNIIEDAVHNHGQDYAGTLHDIYTMAKLAIRKGQGRDTLLFSVIIASTHRGLKLHIGPGDDPAPVLTLMLPFED